MVLCNYLTGHLVGLMCVMTPHGEMMRLTWCVDSWDMSLVLQGRTGQVLLHTESQSVNDVIFCSVALDLQVGQHTLFPVIQTLMIP